MGEQYTNTHLGRWAPFGIQHVHSIERKGERERERESESIHPLPFCVFENYCAFHRASVRTRGHHATNTHVGLLLQGYPSL